MKHLLDLLAKLFVLGPAMVLSNCSGISAGHEQFRSITVCELHDNPKFRGEKLRIRALVESDFTEYTSINDSSCPKKGVLLGGGEVPGYKASQQFDRAMLKKMREGGTVTATIYGVAGVNENGVSTLGIMYTEDVEYER